MPPSTYSETLRVDSGPIHKSQAIYVWHSSYTIEQQKTHIGWSLPLHTRKLYGWIQDLYINRKRFMCGIPHTPSNSKKAHRLMPMSFFGGRWWIRTTEVSDNRFTVCPLWPLGKSPIWSWWSESNQQPADYKSAALPLSHTSIFRYRRRRFPHNDNEYIT